jgi:hypothetical protein
LGYIGRMLWKLFQICVFLSVMFTGVYYEWTPNTLALSIVALVAAMLATVLLGDAIRLVGWSSNKLRAILKKSPRNSLTDRRRVL